MKKLLGILAIATLLSCSKDDDNKGKEDCNCGNVIAKRQPDLKVGIYSYDLKNKCTGEFEVMQSSKSYNIGDKACR